MSAKYESAKSDLLAEIGTLQGILDRLGESVENDMLDGTEDLPRFLRRKADQVELDLIRIRGTLEEDEVGWKDGPNY